MTTPDYADKISKLLRKAEGASTEAEAEAFFTKAQALMVKYAISEAELSLEEQDEVTEDTHDLTGIFRSPLFQMTIKVARVNGLRVLIDKLERISKKDAEWRGIEPRPHTLRVYLVGFKSDINGVKALARSLELQALREMRVWWDKEGRETYETPWATKTDMWRAKVTFIDGFGARVAERLREAKQHAVQEVAEERFAARTTESTETVEDFSDSVALVLRSRQERVDEWYDRKYGGKTRVSTVGQYRRGGVAASAAGKAAGSRADLGQSRMGGSKRLPS